MNSSSERIEQTKVFLWMRIVAGIFMLSVATLQAFKHPHDTVSWVNSLSVACFLALFRLRQPTESRWAYLTNTRVLLTNVAALSVVVTSVWYLVRIAQ